MGVELSAFDLHRLEKVEIDAKKFGLQKTANESKSDESPRDEDDIDDEEDD